MVVRGTYWALAAAECTDYLEGNHTIESLIHALQNIANAMRPDDELDAPVRESDYARLGYTVVSPD